MSLPSGYTQLSFLQSDGNQYIDTGFAPNQDTRVICDVIYDTPSESGSHYLFGARKANASLSYGVNAYGGVYQSMYNSETEDMGSGIATRFTIDKNKNVITFNGTSYTQTYGAFTCPVSMMLFALNNNGSAYGFSSAKLFSCKIYDNEALIRDFIPARNASGAMGLWDDVNSVFYTDGAGGSFVDPTLPVGDHNVLLGGVAYEIIGGTVLLGGVEYELESGMAMVGGVEREITFQQKPVTITVTIGDVAIGANVGDYAYITVNGKKYYEAITLEVAKGTEMVCYANGYRNNTSYIYVNGTTVASGVPARYTYTVNKNISATLNYPSNFSTILIVES